MPETLTFAALKEKQRAIRDGFPETMSLRVHRAISWRDGLENLNRGDEWTIRVRSA